MGAEWHFGTAKAESRGTETPERGEFFTQDTLLIWKRAPLGSEGSARNCSSSNSNPNPNLCWAELSNLGRAHFLGVGSNHWCQYRFHSWKPLTLPLHTHRCSTSSGWGEDQFMWGAGLLNAPHRETATGKLPFSQVRGSRSKPGSLSGPPQWKNELSLLFWRENTGYMNPSSLDTLSN